MPFDVVKTRMQSLSAKKEYRNALHCAYRIATEEGVLRFWKGTVPRLGRLIVRLCFPLQILRYPRHARAAQRRLALTNGVLQLSGGIIFTIYEKVYPVAASIV